MPELQYAQEAFDQFVVNSYDGGMKTNPQKPNESFLIYNMYMREDGKLIPRGTIFEYQLPANVRDSTAFQLDTVVNNSGGMLYNNQTTPYFFFLENYPSAGNLAFWVVNFNNLGQYIFNAIDKITSTSTPNPTVPAYCYAIDKNGAPFFLFDSWNCTGDDKLYTFNGSVVQTVSSSPPASQIMLGYYDRSTFSGGGSVNGSIAMRSMVNWSDPLSFDAASWPVSQFTAPFADRGMVLQDLVVVNGRPILLSNVSYLSLTGDATNYIPVEISRVEDVLLKSTPVVVGTEVFVAGINGVYTLTTNFKDISLPIKGIYKPKTNNYGRNTAITYTGAATTSSNGYFYGIQANALPNTWSLITPTANEQDNLLVYDTRFKIWYYWGVPFKIRGIASIQPKPPVINTQALNFLSGFVMTGASPSNNNAIYELQATNTTGNDTVDGTPVNYTTGFVTAPIDFGIPYGLKHIGGFHIIGVTGGTVKLFVEEIDDSNETKTQIFTASVTALPTFIPWATPKPVRQVRVTLQADSTTVLDEIVIYWRLEKTDTVISQYTPAMTLFNKGDTVTPGQVAQVNIHRNLQVFTDEWYTSYRMGDTVANPFSTPTDYHRILALFGEAPSDHSPSNGVLQ